mgnify:CR=1 FL=1
MLADLSGMPIEIPDIQETAALGAALVSMVGAGQYPSLVEAIRSFDIGVKTITPNLDNTPHYQAKYQRYLKFIDLLKTYEEIA